MRPSPEKLSAFRRTIWNYYRRSGRVLPWRKTRDPYRILVSEVMLQQTQVDRVIPKYPSFLRRFPNVASLARAPLTAVLRVWQGLGYNRRALYLQRAAQAIVARHGGRVPRGPEVLVILPGIGPATAGAIAAFAFQKPVPFLETNIRRVYIHFFFPKSRRVPDARILRLVAATASRKNPREWYYALMDYGAMLGKEKGSTNPNRRSRQYARQPRFEGSRRQARGAILRAILADTSVRLPMLARELRMPIVKVKTAYDALHKEGLITEKPL
ncbi:MAG: A/G-specific adenine glycosylase [Patescibacteria group bacterium]